MLYIFFCDALHNLSLHYAIHNNKQFMMDDMFLYHASHLFKHWLFCANQHLHVRIMMDDVYIYHAHTIFPLSLFCLGTHVYSSTSQSQESTKRALEGIDALGSRELPFPPLSSRNDYAHLSLGSHSAMGYIPLLASCSFYRVHFACYACFYAFAMQL